MPHRDPEARRAYNRDYQRRWRASHLPRAREIGRNSGAKHRVARRDYARRMYPVQSGPKEFKRIHGLYGVTPKRFDEMLQEQAGRCLICEEPLRHPAVDHCHETGKVRGLLCRRCNTAIGGLHDDPALLQRAIEYLTKET